MAETGFKMSDPEVKQTENNCLHKDFCRCSCIVLPTHHQPSSCPHQTPPTSLLPTHELPPVFSSHCLGRVIQGLVLYLSDSDDNNSCLILFLYTTMQTDYVGGQTSMPVEILSFIRQDSITCSVCSVPSTEVAINVCHEPK